MYDVYYAPFLRKTGKFMGCHGSRKHKHVFSSVKFRGFAMIMKEAEFVLGCFRKEHVDYIIEYIYSMLFIYRLRGSNCSK